MCAGLPANWLVGGLVVWVGTVPATLYDRSRSEEDRGTVAPACTAPWIWEVVDRVRVWVLRARRVELRAEISLLMSATVRRRVERIGIMVALPKENLSTSEVSGMGSMAAGRSGVSRQAPARRLMKVCAASPCVGAAITALE